MQGPLARTPSSNERLHRLVDQLLARVESACGPAHAIVLTGSLARGEGTILVDGGESVILSDIDMAVIFEDQTARDLATPRLNQVARDMISHYSQHGLLAAIDLGSYALEDLPKQAPRPGTLELRRNGVVLRGNPRVLGLVRDYTAHDIPRDEVLFLCENRLLELLWASSALECDEKDSYAALYAGGKAVLDGGLAWLISRGDYPEGIEARATVLHTRPPAELGSGCDEYLGAVRFWSRFKLDPDVGELHRRFPGETKPSGLATRAWKEGAFWLLQIYRNLVEEQEPTIAGNGAAWLAAARRAPLRRRVRRWAEAWLERDERGLDWATVGGALARARRGTPEHLLGACAAALVASAPEMNGEPPDREAAERMARAVSPVAWSEDSSWQERRTQLVTAWDRWVLRGTRTGDGGAPWDAH